VTAFAIALAASRTLVRADDVPSARTPVVPAASAERAEPAGNGYWSEGEARLFVAGQVDLGIPYLKPGVSLGYGVPHWLWAGVDVNAISTLEFAQTYGGVRAASPILDLAFGVRDTWSFGKAFLTLPPFTRDDVVLSSARKARYWAWEAEAVASVPLPHSALVADLVIVRLFDIEKGQYVYDESYRVVVSTPTFYVLRMAAVARLLRGDALKVGVLTVHVFGTGRARSVWQLGPAAALQLTDHLEFVAALALQVYGPDTLGLSLGAYGIAGFRYRWATGEREPKLPWSGAWVP
jgi:hypothetical protein